ncbi:hypothetical protein PAPYR_4653 [Paratrimastix pyriformis]|uniref:Uncharacterized protein n=1 Tax=Paratrimastix pyriformis TaxID=342808 RepID=A0ABQ8UJE9_9EUKA|nr:hypothetical protein PAPYR_4653 [Paratrimastix pyriformis]
MEQPNQTVPQKRPHVNPPEPSVGYPDLPPLPFDNDLELLERKLLFESAIRSYEEHDFGLHKLTTLNWQTRLQLRYPPQTSLRAVRRDLGG